MHGEQDSSFNGLRPVLVVAIFRTLANRQLEPKILALHQLRVVEAALRQVGSEGRGGALILPGVALNDDHGLENNAAIRDKLQLI